MAAQKALFSLVMVFCLVTRAQSLSPLHCNNTYRRLMKQLHLHLQADPAETTVTSSFTSMLDDSDTEDEQEVIKVDMAEEDPSLQVR